MSVYEKLTRIRLGAGETHEKESAWEASFNVDTWDLYEILVLIFKYLKKYNKEIERKREICLKKKNIQA